jgi:site-specific DNA-methyltransferase (cytosine-N4-specific)
LLETKKFNAGKRPSEHGISATAFAKNNGGSIPHNLFELDPIDPNRDVRLPHNVLSFSNTTSNDYYFKKCRRENITPHPTRMHGGLINFFTEFLTEENDLILDPFAGSNTTGYCAERLKRRWIAIEANEDYAYNSIIRFEEPGFDSKLQITTVAGEQHVRAKA